MEHLTHRQRVGIAVGGVMFVVILLLVLLHTTRPSDSVTTTPPETATPTLTPKPPFCANTGYEAVRTENPDGKWYWDCTGNMTATPANTWTPEPTPTSTPTATATRTIGEQIASWDEEGNSATPLLVEDAANGFIFLIQLFCGGSIILLLLALITVLVSKRVGSYVKAYREQYGNGPKSAAPVQQATDETLASSGGSIISSHPYSYRTAEEPQPPGSMPWSIPVWWKRILIAVFGEKTGPTYLFLRGSNNPTIDHMNLTTRWVYWGGDLLTGALSDVTDIQRIDAPGMVLEMCGIGGYKVRKKDTSVVFIYLETGGSLHNKASAPDEACRWPEPENPTSFLDAAASLREALWYRVQLAARLRRKRETQEEAVVRAEAAVIAQQTVASGAPIDVSLPATA